MLDPAAEDADDAIEDADDAIVGVLGGRGDAENTTPKENSLLWWLYISLPKTHIRHGTHSVTHDAIVACTPMRRYAVRRCLLHTMV
jgi:hypothetical protein